MKGEKIMNETLKTLKEKRRIRKYKTEHIIYEQMHLILEAR